MTRDTDVLVVGGGILGCATAYELARRGIRVTLLERAELAAGASGRNHGLLLTPLDPALRPMAEAAGALYTEALLHFPVPVYLDPHPIGFLVVPLHPDERAAALAEADAARDAAVPVEHLRGDALRAAEPTLTPAASEGWLLGDGRRLDPAALTVGLGLLAREHGGRILRHLGARALLLSDGAVRGVVTDEGTVEAETVVLAAGPWSPPLVRPLGIHLPVVGARGWLVQVGPVSGLGSRLVGRAGWHTLPLSEPLTTMNAGEMARARGTSVVGTLVQPNPDGTILLGGSRQAALVYEPEDPDVPREILRQAVRLVPALAGVPVLSAWWGIRPMTPDGRPIVGRVRDGLIVATGHGSQGVILAGGTARLVTSLVTGDPPPFDAQSFAPERFARGPMARPARNIGT